MTCQDIKQCFNVMTCQDFINCYNVNSDKTMYELMRRKTTYELKCINSKSFKSNQHDLQLTLSIPINSVNL